MYEVWKEKETGLCPRVCAALPTSVLALVITRIGMEAFSMAITRAPNDVSLAWHGKYLLAHKHCNTKQTLQRNPSDSDLNLKLKFDALKLEHQCPEITAKFANTDFNISGV